jgi:hypothetical protein
VRATDGDYMSLSTRFVLLVEWDGAKTRREFSQDVVSVGRAELNDLVLRSLFISRRHFSIIRDGRRLILEDAQSSGGIYVNGEKVVRRVLRCNDVIELNSGSVRVLLGPGESDIKADPALLSEALAPDTPAHRLESLAELGYLSVRRLIAARPDAPSSALIRLSESFDEETLQALSKNPQLPVASAPILAGLFPEDFLQNPLLPLLLLEDPSLGCFSSEVLCRLVRCASFPSEILFALAEHPSEYVRLAILEHPDLSPATRARVANYRTSRR